MQIKIYTFPFQQLQPLPCPPHTHTMHVKHVNELISWVSCRSAGCVFVEMVQGQPVFAGTSSAPEQLEKIWTVSKTHPEMGEKGICCSSSRLNCEVWSIGPVNSRNNLVRCAKFIADFVTRFIFGNFLTDTGVNQMTFL